MNLRIQLVNNKIKLINPVNSYLNEDILKELYEYNMDNNLNVICLHLFSYIFTRYLLNL